MKDFKYLFMALPLFAAACTSEELVEPEKAANQFAGIEKVDAVFASDIEKAQTRMATQFGLEQNDKVGLAWLGYFKVADDNANVGTNDGSTFEGLVYQNHPLFVDGGYLKPATSIYVGDYFSYLPYDATTVQPGKINFDLSTQPLATNKEAAAAKSIWISKKNTKVTSVGNEDGKDKAGIDGVFNIYPRQFSNLIKIDAKYQSNAPTGEGLDPATIKKIEVALGGTLATDENGHYNVTASDITKFTYAPTSDLCGNFTPDQIASSTWKGEKIPTTEPTPYVTIPDNTKPYVLVDENGVSTADVPSGSFYFNALPVNQGNATSETAIVLKVTTDYGVIYVSKKVNECLKTAYTKTVGGEEKTLLSNSYDGVAQAEGVEAGVAIAKSAINTLGNTAVITATLDFKTAKLHGMHVKDNAELIKLLKFYKHIESTEIATLYLDGDENKEFVMDEEAAGLLAAINEVEIKIDLKPCNEHNARQQEGTVEIVLENNANADGEAMPMLNFFKDETPITLRGAWNLSETKNDLTKKYYYTKVSKFINEGVVNFSGTVNNVIGNYTSIENMESGTVNVKDIVYLDMDLTNLGTINISENKELRVRKTLTNDATGIATEKQGQIKNNGVLAKVLGTNGKIYNYGIIDRSGSKSAKTYITANESEDAMYKNAWLAATNKFGTIILDSKDDNDYSISDGENQGFIKLILKDQETIGRDMIGSEANYVVVDGETKTFNVTRINGERLRYVEFNNSCETVWTSASDINWSYIIVNQGKKVNIKKGNKVSCVAGYIQGTVYVGGSFAVTQYTGYLGGNTLDQGNILQY